MVADWILISGNWNDAGVWQDVATWVDGADVVGVEATGQVGNVGFSITAVVIPQGAVGIGQVGNVVVWGNIVPDPITSYTSVTPDPGSVWNVIEPSSSDIWTEIAA